MNTMWLCAADAHWLTQQWLSRRPSRRPTLAICWLSRQNNSLLGSADLSNITQRVFLCLCLRHGVAWLLAEDMAAKMELAPLRPWDDFFPGMDRFAKPEFGDLTKWNNRVISNLMYYQTNYFAAALVVFIIVGWVLEGGRLANAH